ncbi:Cobyrinic acid ac-diamide synthase [Denitrovibrio acetiphilus DSM 12809]|uniref:Cobyrinic acid ac-diamide synthase n=1 Tax=Denitrovibrio acetiphilus (strain DSM 12809 / NBRC 114555 / N2460) TaxID=522772 RepID=D4H5N9_DENA2|nr:ParA family protein [Denitrovibrio acetiphilus]ADD69480.1 Cobyrinic acid ac-diamide synthase [Denitrovibrio acetiphilus DSM 12809]
MASVVTFANKKGGSGKTSSVVNSGGVLGERGYKVLLVDLDPQAHLSFWSGVNTYNNYLSVYDALLGSCSGRDCLHKAEHGLYDVLPAATNFSMGLLRQLLDGDKPEGKLAKVLMEFKNEYDYILIDTPPTVAVLTLNALVAATHVMIPILLNFLAIEGLAQLTQSIYRINAGFNPDVRMTGIIANQYDIRSNHSKRVLKEIYENFGDDMVAPRIRNDIKIAEAPEYREPINVFAPRSRGNMDFNLLADFIEEKTAITGGEV